MRGKKGGRGARHEFAQAARDLGYQGNIRELMHKLGLYAGTTLSLGDLDPKAADELDDFYKRTIAECARASVAAPPAW